MSGRNVMKPEPALGPRLLTTKEAAGLLRIGLRTLQELVSEGRLPVVRIRAVVRVDLHDVLALINTSKTDLLKRED